jgi:hypothetical protein
MKMSNLLWKLQFAIKAPPTVTKQRAACHPSKRCRLHIYRKSFGELDTRPQMVLSSVSTSQLLTQVEVALIQQSLHRLIAGTTAKEFEVITMSINKWPAVSDYSQTDR